MTEAPQDTQKQMSQLVSSTYNRLPQDLAEIKKQQWAIVNYSMAIFAAIFGLAVHFKGSLAGVEKCVGTIIIVVAFILACILLWKNQTNIGDIRERLKEIELKYAVNEEELKILKTNSSKSDCLRDAPFLTTLIGVLVIGVILAVYALSRLPI